MNRIAAASSLMAVVALGLVASARGAAAPDPIAARHDAMEAVGGAMKSLGAIAKGQVPFDVAVVQKNAGTIGEQLKAAADLFPPGSDKGTQETWAKAEVWSDRAGFEAALKKAQAAAAALQAVKDEAGFRAGLGELGQSCKGCHDTYRRPKP